MRLVFAGTPHAAVPSLEALLDSEHEVLAVITRPDGRAGRGRTLHPSPVKQRALAAGVEVLTPARPTDSSFLDRLRQLAPQVCPIVAYGALLPPEVLAIPSHGWVNLHFSLLPAWRGAAPVQHALLSGDDVTGASTFLLDAGMDTGPVLGTMTERIKPQDTAGDLLSRLAVAGASLLVATIDAMAAGQVAAVPQPGEGVSYAPKVTVADAQVRWADPAQAVDRRIRAVTPDPGAWSALAGQRVRLGPVELASDATGEALAPGELAVQGQQVLVGTASTPVRLGMVQPAGKRMMPAVDWARGARLAPQARFDLPARDDAQEVGG